MQQGLNLLAQALSALALLSLWVLFLCYLRSAHPVYFPAHASSHFCACCLAEHFEQAQEKHIYADAGFFCQSRNSPAPSHRPPSTLSVFEPAQVPSLRLASKHALLLPSRSLAFLATPPPSSEIISKEEIRKQCRVLFRGFRRLLPAALRCSWCCLASLEPREPSLSG